MRGQSRRQRVQERDETTLDANEGSAAPLDDATGGTNGTASAVLADPTATRGKTGFVCTRVKGTAGDEDTPMILIRETRRVIQRFISIFMAEAVIGIFIYNDQAGIEALAFA